MARVVLASGAQWSDDGDLLPENSNLTDVLRRLRSETIVVNATGQSEPAPPAAAEDQRGLYSVLSLPPLNRTVMRKQVLASDAPQDLAARPGGDPSRKQSGGRAANHPIAAAGDLMKRAEREAASRQTPVDLLDAEGKRCATARRAAFEALNAISKLRDGMGGRIHLLGNSFRWWYGMFSICSQFGEGVKLREVVLS